MSSLSMVDTFFCFSFCRSGNVSRFQGRFIMNKPTVEKKSSVAGIVVITLAGYQIWLREILRI